MHKERLNFRLLNFLILLGAIFLIYMIKGLWLGIVGKILAIISPFLVAFAIAYALNPFVRTLVKKGMPRWLSIGVVFTFVAGLLVTLIILVIPLLYKQTLLFLTNISAFISEMSTKYDLNTGDMQSTISNITQNIVNTIGSYISDGAINIVNQSFGIIASIVIILFVAIYFLIDMDRIRHYIKVNLKSYKNRSYAYVLTLDKEITHYFSGMGKNMLVQFIEYTFVFFIIGHPNFLLLGILAAVTNIIPYIGGFIVNILALIIASVISARLAIWTLVICMICPQLDSYVIGPKIFGKTNNLHPLVNIFAVFAGGLLFGFSGIIISLPVAIVIITTYKFFKKDINEKIVELKEKV